MQLFCGNDWQCSYHVNVFTGFGSIPTNFVHIITLQIEIRGINLSRSFYKTKSMVTLAMCDLNYLKIFNNVSFSTFIRTSDVVLFYRLPTHWKLHNACRNCLIRRTFLNEKILLFMRVIISIKLCFFFFFLEYK